MKSLLVFALCLTAATADVASWTQSFSAAIAKKEYATVHQYLDKHSKHIFHTELPWGGEFEGLTGFAEVGQALLSTMEVRIGDFQMQAVDEAKGLAITLLTFDATFLRSKNSVEDVVWKCLFKWNIATGKLKSLESFAKDEDSVLHAYHTKAEHQFWQLSKLMYSQKEIEMNPENEFWRNILSDTFELKILMSPQELFPAKVLRGRGEALAGMRVLKAFMQTKKDQACPCTKTLAKFLKKSVELEVLVADENTVVISWAMEQNVIGHAIKGVSTVVFNERGQLEHVTERIITPLHFWHVLEKPKLVWGDEDLSEQILSKPKNTVHNVDFAQAPQAPGVNEGPGTFDWVSSRMAGGN